MQPGALNQKKLNKNLFFYKYFHHLGSQLFTNVTTSNIVCYQKLLQKKELFNFYILLFT